MSCSLYPLVVSLLAVLVAVTKMNLLTQYGVNANLSKLEFVDILSIHPAETLKGLRQSLFCEYTALDISSNDFQDIPLVARRDSALRPVQPVLSEDCWIIVNCISNKTSLPRVLLKNGKRERSSVLSQSRSSSSAVSQLTCVSDHSESLASQSQQNLLPTPVINTTSTPAFTSQSQISNRLIARELSALSDKITTLRSEVDILKSSSSRSPSPDPQSNSVDIIMIKDELKILHNKINTLSPSYPSIDNLQQNQASTPTSSSISINLTSWNCRGITSALPYLHHLIKNGSDIIALSEHWLWPYNLESLTNLHPDYNGFGYCDSRLNENSSLTRGCGGVGFLWKKSLNITPVTDISSDRLCVVQLHTSFDVPLTIVAVYMPSSNYSIDEYTTYFQDLQSVIGTFERNGPIVLCGDLNVDISNPTHSPQRNQLLDNLVDCHSLFIASQSSTVSGPSYTYFSDTCQSVLDYIITSSSLAGCTNNCFVHPVHPLNMSDHLPQSIVLHLCHLPFSTPPSLKARINWDHAVANGDISLYADAVSLVIEPLLQTSGHSIAELNQEIMFVTETLVCLAESYLPIFKKKIDSVRFDSPELSQLCKDSKKSWKAWIDCGRPQSGPLLEAKQNAKKSVRSCINTLRASSVRRNIQHRDMLFKTGDARRFRLPNNSASVCGRLLTESGFT